MHLDAGLVRGIIREVVGQEPFDRFFLGRCLIVSRGSGIDNGQTTSQLMSRGLPTHHP